MLIWLHSRLTCSCVLVAPEEIVLGDSSFVDPNDGRVVFLVWFYDILFLAPVVLIVFEPIGGIFVFIVVIVIVFKVGFRGLVVPKRSALEHEDRPRSMHAHEGPDTCFLLLSRQSPLSVVREAHASPLCFLPLFLLLLALLL